MAIIDINGNVDYWYEGEGSTDIGQTNESIGEQDYWYQGAPTGYFVGATEQTNNPYSFAVLIGF
jgi:hypothetical protein